MTTPFPGLASYIYGQFEYFLRSTNYFTRKWMLKKCADCSSYIPLSYCFNCSKMLCSNCQLRHISQNTTENHYVVDYPPPRIRISKLRYLKKKQHCEHRDVGFHCRECDFFYCMTCLTTYACCAHDRFLLCDAIIKMKKDSENLEKRFNKLFTEVASRIQEAIDSYRMTTNLRIPDIIRIGIQNSYGWYISRLIQITANLCTIAEIIEESLRSGNPFSMAKTQILTLLKIEVLERSNSTTHLCTSHDGISIMTLTHGFRCELSIQINSINLYNYNRPIYGVRHPVVIEKGKLSVIKAIGKRGRGDLEFCKPWGVACNAEGLVIVTDRSNDRIKVLDPEGNFLWQFGQTGARLGDLYRPAGVTVNKAGNIVVADKDNHRIQIFTISGEAIRAFGRQGSRPGELHYPYSVHCNAKEEILVSDSKNQRIQLFQEDGVLLRIFKFGIRLNPYVKLCDTPRDVCFTPTENVLVSDFETHAILRFNSSLNQPPFSFGSEGTAIGQFQRPQGIACDDAGNVVIADSKNHRIILKNSSGDFECIFSGTGGEDLNRPCGICITPKGRLIVVDMGNDRILFL
ncbi:hypothetical protein WA026_021723 [Henosepilachna vigintioctopunctata]|uniref:B box-type domain-containing protein n=1 Tax=Henosepilachna vigintioctopunctata TaxID=420089 RepID=A0AAW1TYF5_9CUCU